MTPKIIAQLYKQYPNLYYYLHFENPFQLVIAAMLSPQVRDVVVNKVTPDIFTKYPTPKELASTDVDTLTKEIIPVTFATPKAKHLIETANVLVNEFGGEVPKTLENLTKLPGVGEKTAHAILQNAFGIVQGICVDTHVLRVSYRVGLTTNPKNPKKTEDELKLEKISIRVA